MPESETKATASPSLNTLNDVFAALCFVKLVVTHEWGINLVALGKAFGVASVPQHR